MGNSGEDLCHHQIDVGENLSNNYVSLNILMISLLLFSAALTMLTNYVDRALVGRRYYALIVGAVYKELVIVGSISFLLFVADFSGLVTKIFCGTGVTDSGTFPREVFEIAHFLLFMVMVTYTLTALALMIVTKVHCAFWTSAEKCGDDRAAEERERAKGEAADRSTRGFFSRYLARRREIRWIRILAFKALRKRFIHQHALPDDFKFSSYLSKAARSQLTRFIQVHWVIWLALLLVIILNFSRIAIEGRARQSPRRQFAFVVGFGFLLIPLCLLLDWKVRRIHARLKQRAFESVGEVITSFANIVADDPVELDNLAASGASRDEDQAVPPVPLMINSASASAEPTAAPVDGQSQPSPDAPAPASLAAEQGDNSKDKQSGIAGLNSSTDAGDKTTAKVTLYIYSVCVWIYTHTHI
jgi:hypothetical protein